MKVYLYAKSGHSIGLDATRRCAAIANVLKENDPILCTCDFRAGAYAKEELGIKKYVSVDILSNLPNMMQRGDILFYDSDEASDFMQNHMEEFASFLYKIGKDIPYTIVDKTHFVKGNQSIEKTFFYGDDDYENTLLDLCKDAKEFDIPLQMGHYFFLGNEKVLQNHFSKLFEEEEYIETIKNTKYLLTGSFNAAIESLECGNNPVLLLREDKSYDKELIKSLNLPTINNNSLENIFKEFDTICQEKVNYKKVEEFSFETIIKEINEKIKVFNKINPEN